jgi:hypothetical protein
MNTKNLHFQQTPALFISLGSNKILVKNKFVYTQKRVHPRLVAWREVFLAKFMTWFLTYLLTFGMKKRHIERWSRVASISYQITRAGDYVNPAGLDGDTNVVGWSPGRPELSSRMATPRHHLELLGQAVTHPLQYFLRLVPNCISFQQV